MEGDPTECFHSVGPGTEKSLLHEERGATRFEATADQTNRFDIIRVKNGECLQEQLVAQVFEAGMGSYSTSACRAVKEDQCTNIYQAQDRGRFGND